MINLLPDNQKNELRQEENLKLVLILGLVLIFYLLSLGLLLFLVRGFLSTDLDVQKTYFNQKTTRLEALKGLKDETSSANSNFLKLKIFYDSQINYADIFNKLYPALPPGINLYSINFLSEKEKTAVISLQGFSKTREELSSFKSNLESDKEFFSDINFPPESWIKKNDITFTITFNVLLDK
jgi:Tfp pilus assembly protein PilN